MYPFIHSFIPISQLSIIHLELFLNVSVLESCLYSKQSSVFNNPNGASIINLMYYVHEVVRNGIMPRMFHSLSQYQRRSFKSMKRWCFFCHSAVCSKIFVKMKTVGLFRSSVGSLLFCVISFC